MMFAGLTAVLGSGLRMVMFQLSGLFPELSALGRSGTCAQSQDVVTPFKAQEYTTELLGAFAQRCSYPGELGLNASTVPHCVT